MPLTFLDNYSCQPFFLVNHFKKCSAAITNRTLLLLISKLLQQPTLTFVTMLTSVCDIATNISTMHKWSFVRQHVMESIQPIVLKICKMYLYSYYYTLVAALTLAFNLISLFTMWRWPSCAAKWRGVHPSCSVHQTIYKHKINTISLHHWSGLHLPVTVVTAQLHQHDHFLKHNEEMSFHPVITQKQTHFHSVHMLSASSNS